MATLNRTVTRSAEKGGYDSPLPEVDTKKLMRKIDLRILPILLVLYLLAFLDRVNISNAALFGLETDLRLTGIQFNTALVIFFVPYAVFEIPSNILLKRFKPHVWLSLSMFGFGLVSVLQGLTQNYAGLLATRFFLGFFEAGLFPACNYILAMWYRREESQKRFTFFFGSCTLAGAFGGLLASAIGKMDGLQGYRGWRWIFILEGILSCLIAIIWYFIVPDFPEDATFLTEDEREAVQERLSDDVGHSAVEKPIGWRDVIHVLSDYKIFLGAFMYFGLIVPAYGYAYFAPTIIKGLGYGAIESQLRSVPPWACAFVFSMIVAYISDRLRHRYLFAAASALIAVAGYAILLTVHDNVHVQYGALFLAAMGTYTSMPIVLGWFNTNLAGHHRRAIGSAWQIGFGNIGGIVASYAFPSKDGPKFIKGYGVCLAFVCFGILSSTVYFIAITSENRNRDRLAASNAPLPSDDEKLGDLDPNYRYLG